VSDSQSASRQAPALPAPETCPRFHPCGASICPLAPDEGYHRKGEEVCRYLLCSGKDGADAYFAGRPEEDPTYGPASWPCPWSWQSTATSAAGCRPRAGPPIRNEFPVKRRAGPAAPFLCSNSPIFHNHPRRRTYTLPADFSRI
jgi:hypothetical protein